jgi:hypothetical protein
MKYHKPERIPRLGSLLVFVLVMFCLLAFASFHAMAEGTVYSGNEKQVRCTNPTERTDGTPLDPAEIDRVEIFIGQTDQDINTPHKVTMPGGCTDTAFDLTQLQEGQWYQYGIAVDTAGRISSLSATLPFEYQKSAPLPPVMVE